jgi:hypothetical protein
MCVIDSGGDVNFVRQGHDHEDNMGVLHLAAADNDCELDLYLLYLF